MIRKNDSEGEKRMAEERRGRIDDTDSFWDIDYMLPSKSRKVFSNDTDTVKLDFGASDGDAGEVIPKKGSSADPRLEKAREVLRRFDPQTGTVTSVPSPDAALPGVETEETVWKPSDNHLISSVTVRNWASRYYFYERFVKDAEKYFSQTAENAVYVPFFSFMPQYVQLNAEQLRWYLYWREKVRGGEVPATDYSYILLYIYEIINLPTLIPPKEGAVMLARLWAAYRDAYPKIDAHLCEWLCDYCLTYNEPLPYEIIAPFAVTGTGTAKLREFYIGNSVYTSFSSSLLNICSNYKWQESKFCTEETRPTFEKYMNGCAGYVFSQKEIRAYVDKCIGKVHIIRDSFVGAVCAYNVKKRIEVEYLSCMRSVELRIHVTFLVKYIENNIRSLLGIKSRFHVADLPPSFKKACDEYFAPLRERQKRVKTEEREEPAPYEAFYEPESHGFDPKNAEAIEKDAWETASVLISAFEDEEPEADIPAEDETSEMPPEISAVPPETGGVSDAPDDKLMKTALAALISGDPAAFEGIAKSINLLPETLAERINERACDIVGDIVLEPGENGFVIISDYLEEITEWMNS